MMSEFDKEKINKTVLSENVISIEIAIGCLIIAIATFDCLRVACSRPMTIENPWILYCLMILICVIFGISCLLDIHKQKKCLTKMFECLDKIKSNIWQDNSYEIKYIDNPEKFEADLFDELSDIKELIYGKHNADFGSIYSYKELIEEKIKDTYSETNKFYALRNPSMYIEVELVEERSIILTGLLFKDAIKDEFVVLYEYEKDNIDKTFKRVKLFKEAEKSNVILTVPYINEMNKTMLYKDQIEFIKEHGELVNKHKVPGMVIDFYDFDEEDEK